jgi:histidinol-phosphate phosphatase family protein
MPNRRACFLDRDGTLIHDGNYLRDPAEIHLLPGVVEALRRLHDAGFLLIVVSNQSGIGRGMITPAEHAAVHQRFTDLFAAQGIHFDRCWYCPHAPEEDCACRKPQPEFLLRCAADFSLELSGSYMIGDKLSDVRAGRAAGCRTVLLAKDGEGPCPAAHDLVDIAARDLREACERMETRVSSF